MNISTLIKYKNHTNLLLTIPIYELYSILNKQFKINLNERNDTNNNNNIIYTQSTHTYGFNMKLFNNNNYNSYFDFIYNIISTKPYTQCYLIFYNFDNINKNIQNKLCGYIKHFVLYKYIILTKYISSISSKLKSNFIYIRSQIDTTNSIIYDITIKNIFKIYKLHTYTNIVNKIKEISYLICTCNLDINIILRLILDKVINENNNKDIGLIISIFSNSNYDTYNDKLIYLEYILLHIYKICYN